MKRRLSKGSYRTVPESGSSLRARSLDDALQSAALIGRIRGDDSIGIAFFASKTTPKSRISPRTDPSAQHAAFNAGKTRADVCATWPHNFSASRSALDVHTRVTERRAPSGARLERRAFAFAAQSAKGRSRADAVVNGRKYRARRRVRTQFRYRPARETFVRTRYSSFNVKLISTDAW